MEPLKLERYLLLSVLVAFAPFPFFMLAFAGLAPTGLLFYGLVFAVLHEKYVLLLILVLHTALSISLLYLLVILLHKFVARIAQSAFARKLTLIVLSGAVIALSQFRIFVIGDVGGGTHFYDLVSIYQFFK